MGKLGETVLKVLNQAQLDFIPDGVEADASCIISKFEVDDAGVILTVRMEVLKALLDRADEVAEEATTD